MTTMDERQAILNEYGAWVEEKTLEGLDLTIDAYLAEIEADENAHKVEHLKELVNHGDATTFRNRAREILGAANELD